MVLGLPGVFGMLRVLVVLALLALLGLLGLLGLPGLLGSLGSLGLLELLACLHACVPACLREAWLVGWRLPGWLVDSLLVGLRVCNVGAHYTINIIRNPQNTIGIF